MIDCSVDYEKRLLRFTIGPGMLDPERLRRMRSELLRLAGQFERDGLTFDVFADARHSPVQPADVGEYIRETLRLMRGRGLRRHALLVSQTLKKLQMQRLGPHIRAFRSEAEALAWFDAPDAPPAATLRAPGRAFGPAPIQE